MEDIYLFIYLRIYYLFIYLGVWKVANMGIVQTLWDTVSLIEEKMCEGDTHHEGLPTKFCFVSTHC